MMNKLSVSTLLGFLLLGSALSESGETESRSIKNSLDSVLREVKSKLEFFFSRSKQDQSGDLMKSPLMLLSKKGQELPGNSLYSMVASTMLEKLKLHPMNLLPRLHLDQPLVKI